MANIAEDNFLVWNQGKAPLVGHNFMLRVELLFDLPCKSVKAFTREMEYELIQEGRIRPALIIGAPVGFVNVVEAKELIMTAGVPYIVPRGRKGGSNIAAAICNAMLYQGGR